MRLLNKRLVVLLLVLLVIPSLSFVKPTFAQTIAKPSIPEFTPKYIDLSYDVPPIYGIDQYTGKTIITQNGYHIDNRSIQFTIKNQPFTPYTDINGNQTSLYFNFRVKGAYGTEWDYYPFMPDGQSSNTYGGSFVPPEERTPAPAFSQSNAEYTTVTIKIPAVWKVPQGVTLDTQVQAIAGYMYYRDKQYHFVGQYSDWSNTQTISVPDGSVSNSATPTPSPTVPELSWLAVLPLLLSVLAVAVIVKHRKTVSLKQLPSGYC